MIEVSSNIDGVDSNRWTHSPTGYGVRKTVDLRLVFLSILRRDPQKFGSANTCFWILNYVEFLILVYSFFLEAQIIGK